MTSVLKSKYILNEIENHEPSGLGGHPKDIVFLTTDAFGVLPPISRPTPDQAINPIFCPGISPK